MYSLAGDAVDVNVGALVGVEVAVNEVVAGVAQPAKAMTTKEDLKVNFMASLQKRMCSEEGHFLLRPMIALADMAVSFFI